MGVGMDVGTVVGLGVETRLAPEFLELLSGTGGSKSLSRSLDAFDGLLTLYSHTEYK